MLTKIAPFVRARNINHREWFFLCVYGSLQTTTTATLGYVHQVSGPAPPPTPNDDIGATSVANIVVPFFFPNFAPGFIGSVRVAIGGGPYR